MKRVAVLIILIFGICMFFHCCATECNTETVIEKTDEEEMLRELNDRYKDFGSFAYVGGTYCFSGDVEPVYESLLETSENTGIDIIVINRGGHYWIG